MIFPRRRRRRPGSMMVAVSGVVVMLLLLVSHGVATSSSSSSSGWKIRTKMADDDDRCRPSLSSCGQWRPPQQEEEEDRVAVLPQQLSFVLRNHDVMPSRRRTTTARGWRSNRNSMEESTTTGADDDDILITLRGGGSRGGDEEDGGDGGGTTTGAAAATDILRAGAPDEQQRRPRKEKHEKEENAATTTTTTTTTMILRVRAPDGSLQRLQLTEKIRQLTIAELLENLQVTTTGNDNKKKKISSFTVQLDGMAVATSMRIADMPRLKHGSVLAVVINPLTSEVKTPGTKARNSDDADADATGKKTPLPPSSFVPFPDLAKRWNDRRYRANKNKKPTSYAALTAYRDATVHRIEEVSQPKRIEQIYICQNMARRFVEMDNGGTDNDVLILGTIARQHKTKARHSLDDQKTLHKTTLIAKSQAMVVPSEEKDDVWKDVAMYLGLEPIGWMVAAAVTMPTGQKDTNEKSSLLPTSAAILRAARFQIDVMRQKAQRPQQPHGTTSTTNDHFEGFCTIAMDRSSGATEAYQLTDVTVQMVAEGLFHETTTNTFDATKRADKNDHDTNNNILRTKHPIWVDGGESNSLDTLLCLVNTAVLSHTGWYSTKTTRTVKKTNGRLTKVTRTKLLAALQLPKGKAAGNGENNGDAAALDILCDFDLLVALVRMLRSTPPNKNKQDGDDDGRALCETVQQYAKGLKRTTKLNPALRQRIVDLIQSAVA
jgi:hypothetical protein